MATTTPNNTNPQEIASALHHAGKEHGIRLIDALHTSAFSRLPIKDQVDVVKHYADQMPELEHKDFKTGNAKSTGLAALKGLGIAGGMGTVFGMGHRYMKIMQSDMPRIEKETDAKRFLEHDLPIGVVPVALAGASYGGLSHYLNQKHNSKEMERQYNQLKAIKNTDEDKEKNKLALSVLASVPHLNEAYKKAPKSMLLDMIGSPAAAYNSYLKTDARKPTPEEVEALKRQLNKGNK